MKDSMEKRKIIADTSVWIEFLKKNQDFFVLMQELLESNSLIGVECVFAELLQGVKSKREKDIVLSYWDYIPKINETGIWLEAGSYSNDNKFFEKGIGLIDSVLITLSVKYFLKIWTLDKKIRQVLKPEFIYL